MIVSEERLFPKVNRMFSKRKKHNFPMKRLATLFCLTSPAFYSNLAKKIMCHLQRMLQMVKK